MPPYHSSTASQTLRLLSILKTQVSSQPSSPTTAGFPAAQTSDDQGRRQDAPLSIPAGLGLGPQNAPVQTLLPCPGWESGLTHGRQEPSQAFRGKLPAFIRQARATRCDLSTNQRLRQGLVGPPARHTGRQASALTAECQVLHHVCRPRLQSPNLLGKRRPSRDPSAQAGCKARAPRRDGLAVPAATARRPPGPQLPLAAGPESPARAGPGPRPPPFGRSRGRPLMRERGRCRPALPLLPSRKPAPRAGPPHCHGNPLRPTDRKSVV